MLSGVLVEEMRICPGGIAAFVYTFYANVLLSTFQGVGNFTECLSVLSVGFLPEIIAHRAAVFRLDCIVILSEKTKK